MLSCLMASFFHSAYNPQFEESGRPVSLIVYKWFIHGVIANTYYADEDMNIIKNRDAAIFFLEDLVCYSKYGILCCLNSVLYATKAYIVCS